MRKTEKVLFLTDMAFIKANLVASRSFPVKRSHEEQSLIRNEENQNLHHTVIRREACRFVGHKTGIGPGLPVGAGQLDSKPR